MRADNDITHNNLDLIRSLKEEVSDMKRKEITNEKLMFEIAQACAVHGTRRADPPLSNLRSLRHRRTKSSPNP